MNHYLQSRTTRVIFFLGAYLCGFFALATFHDGFRYYLRQNFTDAINILYTPPLFPVFFILALGFFFLFLYSQRQESAKMPPPWLAAPDKADFLILMITSYGTIRILYQWLRFQPNGFRLIFATFIAYCLLMLCFTQIIRRLHQKTWDQNWHWLTFYRIYPPGSRIGFLVCAALIISIFLLFPNRRYDPSYRILISPAFGLVLLNLLTLLSCYFVQVSHLEQQLKSSGQDGLTSPERNYFRELEPISKQLDQLICGYDTALKERIKSERFKTELITNVSHDIKTPLTSIISYIDLLKNVSADSDEFRQYTAVLERKAQRLKVLIEDLMEAAKAGTGNLPVTMLPLDFIELTGQAFGEFEEKMQAADLTLVTKYPKEKVQVLADGRYLFRVIENLFGNAVKYSQPGTRIYAEMSVKEQKAILTLRNLSRDALGITPDELTEQFVRGDKARKTEGSGLGLYIAKSLTELMSGQLAIDIAGDLFSVTLTFQIPQETIS